MRETCQWQVSQNPRTTELPALPPRAVRRARAKRQQRIENYFTNSLFYPTYVFLTIHAAAGILIGQQIQNPVLAFLIGLFSHFLIDMVPHGDEELEIWLKHYKSKKRMGFVVLTDLILALFLSTFFIQKITVKYTYSIIAAISGSTLPDFLYLVWHPWKIFNKPPRKISIKLIKFHSNIQELFKKNLSFKYALGLQILTIILLTFLIL